MALPVYPPISPAPQRFVDTPEVFDTKADPFFADIAQIPENLAAFAVGLVDAASTANYSATSATSLIISAGLKEFVIEMGKLFVAGQPVRISDAADPTVNYMDGVIQSYNITTGAMAVEVSGIAGVGPKTDWFVGVTGPAAGSSAANVQTFTTSGTWSLPAGTWSTVIVEVWGAGGGGAGGGRQAAGNSRWGGGGGGGGSYRRAVFNSSDLGTSVAVTIGAGGFSGAGATTNGYGSAGGDGGNTTFGAFLTAYGGKGGPGTGGPSTAGGDGAGVLPSGSPTGYAGGAGVAGAAGGNAGDGGGAGGGSPANVDSGAGGGSIRGGAGGGAGGAIDSANTLRAAGAGGSQASATGGGGAAGSASAGAAGTAFQGGGGGAANDSGVGYAGGKGGIASGGGGGGGGTGANGGAGGVGGAGFCRVILL